MEGRGDGESRWKGEGMGKVGGRERGWGKIRGYQKVMCSKACDHHSLNFNVPRPSIKATPITVTQVRVW